MYFTGQFLRKGIVVDEVRKLLLMPNKAPVPVERKPVWKYLEQWDKDANNMQYCWAAGNPGLQGEMLIDGHYLDYVVEDLLSFGFLFQAST